MARDGVGRSTSDSVVADLMGHGSYVFVAKFRFVRAPNTIGLSTIQTGNGDLVTAVGGGRQLTNAVHMDAKTQGDWEYLHVLKCGDPADWGVIRRRESIVCGRETTASEDSPNSLLVIPSTALGISCAHDLLRLLSIQRK